MSKPINDDEEKLLKDGQRLRIPMMLVDGKTTKPTTINPSLHRSGYRYLATDAVAATRRQMAYDDYHNRLTNSWRTPEADSAVIDREFDEDVNDGFTGDERERAYQEYERRLVDAWKGE